MNFDYDVVVVGAGPAGMMAAGRAGARGLRVLLIERNARPGRKLLITGKGRCNLTNNCSVEDLLAAVRRGGRFLHSASAAFTPADTMAFFEGLGLPLKTERGRRVFPASDRSVDVLLALRRYMEAGGVQLITGRVSALATREGAITGVLLKDGRAISAPAVVLATGGMSYPATGSDGSGYALAEAVGHSIVPPRASLVPIVIAEDFCAELSGLSLRNVTLSLIKGKKTLFCEIGELLFTHFGISGPLALSASSYIEGSPDDYRLTIDLKPGLDADRLDRRLLRDFEERPNRDFINALGGLLPRSLIPVVVRRSGIDSDTKVHQITRAQRIELGRLLKNFSLTPVGLRPIEEAVVTAGGIHLREVNPKTMGSKLVSGLYFAGEVLDLDAYTGGYNLQIAFATGQAAGGSVGGEKL
jgi:predicted Rossmann fold flavoprotein